MLIAAYERRNVFPTPRRQGSWTAVKLRFVRAIWASIAGPAAAPRDRRHAAVVHALTRAIAPLIASRAVEPTSKNRLSSADGPLSPQPAAIEQAARMVTKASALSIPRVGPILEG